MACMNYFDASIKKSKLYFEAEVSNGNGLKQPYIFSGNNAYFGKKYISRNNS